MKVSRPLGLMSAAVLTATLCLAGAVGSAQAAASDLYVSPLGSNSNVGTNSSSPLQTIQAAFDRASAGMTIHLAPGTYRERPTTKVSGTAAAPITVLGPETGKDKMGRYRAVLSGTSRILNVDHSYYRFQGFTIDGQESLRNAAWPTALSEVRAFKDSVQSKVSDGRLVYIGSSDTSKDITGVVLDDMFLNGAGGECVRMRNHAYGNEVKNSTIQWCGMYGKGDDIDRYKYHNGEGVYIGTSPKSTTQPMYANDNSSYNSVHDNTIWTYGSECFNVKENAHNNTFANNSCRFNDEPVSFDGSQIELRGYANSILGNVITDGRGYGLKLRSDSSTYDKGANSVQGNSFLRLAGAAVLNDQRTPQTSFCGNSFDQSTPVIGSGAVMGDGTLPCISTTSPLPPTPSLSTVTSPSPTPSPSTVTSPSPSSSTTSLAFEAESGKILAPMVVSSAGDASGGKYVVQNATSGAGSVTYTLQIPSQGTWRLSGRVISPGGDANSFRYSYDGASSSTWVLPEVDNWTWASGPSVTLKAGTHTLTILRRESGTRLDALTLVRTG